MHTTATATATILQAIFTLLSEIYFTLLHQKVKISKPIQPVNHYDLITYKIQLDCLLSGQHNSIHEFT